MWYLDCFNWKSDPHSNVGRNFPVESYSSECLEVLVTRANTMLARGHIDEIRISHETKGQSPRNIGFNAECD